MNEEELKKYLKDNFTNYIREIIDSSIIFKYISEIETENNKLNKIIDELEKWLKQETIDLYDEDNPLLLDASFTKYATERKMTYMYVLDKLKELKGDK